MTEQPVPLSDYGGTIIFVLMGFLFLIYAVGPWNWKYVQNRWAGVIIRFGRISKTALGESSLLGEGPVHIWFPFERLVRVPMFDQKVQIPLPNLATAAPNTQNVDILLQAVIRFADPIAVITSVPDRDPVEEFKGFVQAAARSGVQQYTVDEIAGKGAGDALGKYIAGSIRKHPVVKRWGLEIVAMEIRDIDFSAAYRDAQDEVVRAHGDASAMNIRAAARKSAADTVGQSDPKGMMATLFGEQLDAYVKMAQAGAFKTWVNAGNAFDKILSDLFNKE